MQNQYPHFPSLQVIYSLIICLPCWMTPWEQGHHPTLCLIFLYLLQYVTQSRNFGEDVDNEYFSLPGTMLKCQVMTDPSGKSKDWVYKRQKTTMPTKYGRNYKEINGRVGNHLTALHRSWAQAKVKKKEIEKLKYLRINPFRWVWAWLTLLTMKRWEFSLLGYTHSQDDMRVRE